MAALGLTIPGANGAPPLIFTVLGQSLGNMTTAFSNALAAANTANNLTINDIPDSTTSGSGSVVLNEFITTSTPGPITDTIGTGGQYSFYDTSVQTTVTGSSDGGDTVIGTNLFTYDAVGNNNEVNFLYGVNTYNGGTSTGDTITGSAGSDTINTGTGNATVFSGYGHDVINLGDAPDAGGDLVFLGDGNATVNAFGASDTVFTGVSGQVIYGGGVAADTVAGDSVPNTNNLVVVIGSKTQNPSFGGNDVVTAGADNTSVYDTIGGNTIYGGTGNFTFVAGIRPGLIVADTVVGGASGGYIYGGPESQLNISSGADSTGANTLNVVAGSGNETLNGGSAAGNLNFFGNDSTGATSDSATFIGGSGSNTYVTGIGNEDITAGAGSNFIVVDPDVANSNITVFDFGATNDILGFTDSSNESTILSSATVGTTDGVSSLTLTLSDTSTITFVGITSLTGKTV